MTEQPIWIGVVAIALLFSVWFRRNPMSGRTRKFAVAIAIALMGATLLRDRRLDSGMTVLVAFGSIVLILALGYLQRQDKSVD